MIDEPQPARVSLTPEQYANLSSFKVYCRNMEEILDDACGFGELPIDALKRVVEDLTRFHSMVEEQRKDDEGAFGTLCRLISEAQESVAMRLQQNALERERNELKAELDRLNARFAEAQKEWKQPPLPREVTRAYSTLCRALELLPQGEHQKAAILICSTLVDLGGLVFNCQEQKEVKGE